MANFLYVDNSNVWIEGMRVAAVANGLAPTLWDAFENKIVDPSWRLDFGHLMSFAGGERHEVGRAVLSSMRIENQGHDLRGGNRAVARLRGR